MKLHTLTINDSDLIDFSFIAIHTTLEDYRLAFMINKTFLVSFSKFYAPENKTLSEVEKHKVFDYEDMITGSYWEILRNKIESQATVSESGSAPTNMFETVATSTYIVPQKKRVDYFIKIYGAEMETSEIVDRIADLPSIVTAFEVDVHALKSKNNLIY